MENNAEVANMHIQNAPCYIEAQEENSITWRSRNCEQRPVSSAVTPQKVLTLAEISEVLLFGVFQERIPWGNRRQES